MSVLFIVMTQNCHAQTDGFHLQVQTSARLLTPGQILTLELIAEFPAHAEAWWQVPTQNIGDWRVLKHWQDEPVWQAAALQPSAAKPLWQQHFYLQLIAPVVKAGTKANENALPGFLTVDFYQGDDYRKLSVALPAIRVHSSFISAQVALQPIIEIPVPVAVFDWRLGFVSLALLVPVGLLWLFLRPSSVVAQQSSRAELPGPKQLRGRAIVTLADLDALHQWLTVYTGCDPLKAELHPNKQVRKIFKDYQSLRFSTVRHTPAQLTSDFEQLRIACENLENLDIDTQTSTRAGS